MNFIFKNSDRIFLIMLETFFAKGLMKWQIKTIISLINFILHYYKTLHGNMTNKKYMVEKLNEYIIIYLKV